MAIVYREWDRNSAADIINTPDPTPAKPEYLYAWTDPNPITGETLYAWTCDQDGIYVGPNQVHTIYTKTNTIDTSTNIFYLEDGTEISLSELIYGSAIADSIISADANRIQIDFET